MKSTKIRTLYIREKYAYTGKKKFQLISPFLTDDTKALFDEKFRSHRAMHMRHRFKFSNSVQFSTI